MGKGTVQLDFFTHSGLVFADGLCNGRFSRAVGNASKDDPALFQSQMGKSVVIFHMRHQPFRRLSQRIV